MKKLILVVTIAVLGILACKKKDETPTPEKKYEYKRTPGEASRIEGDVFVDTGGTVFTVKGKGFDPSKKEKYHLYITTLDDTLSALTLRNMQAGGRKIEDYAKIISMTESSITYQVPHSNIFDIRDQMRGYEGEVVLDSVNLLFVVESKDSSKNAEFSTKFDKLQWKKVHSQLFFNIVSDTLNWYKSTQKWDTVITVNDIMAGGIYDDRVHIYFNGTKLNTSNTSPNCFDRFDYNVKTEGDGTFIFSKYFYNDNKGLGLIDGFYNVTMKESKTGLPIKERHGKKGVYVKFVN